MARQTLKECVDDYLLDKAAKETRRAYDRALRQFLGFMNVASVEDLAGVDRGAITRFRNHLRDELGRSPAYTNRQICALSGFFKWLLSEQEIQANPCEFVRRYKVEDESRTEGLSETEIQAMVEATKDGVPVSYRNILQGKPYPVVWLGLGGPITSHPGQGAPLWGDRIPAWPHSCRALM